MDHSSEQNLERRSWFRILSQYWREIVPLLASLVPDCGEGVRTIRGEEPQ